MSLNATSTTFDLSLKLPPRTVGSTEAPAVEPAPLPETPSAPPAPKTPVIPIEPMPIIPPTERPDECPETGDPQCPVS
jgi:hypothetical protein